MTDQSTISPHEKSHTPFAPVDPGVRMGHVHLKVADIDRALAFYSGILGFQVTQRMGSQAAFISAGGAGHHRPLPSGNSLSDACGFGGCAPPLDRGEDSARRRLRPRRERGTL